MAMVRLAHDLDLPLICTFIITKYLYYMYPGPWRTWFEVNDSLE